ncbi:deoxyribonuclease-2-alpha-like, partial [Tropilaelaps mercedesae]
VALVVFLLNALMSTVLLHPEADPEGDIHCRNPRNRAVEWFIIYKVPKTAGTSTRRQQYDLLGSEYGYIDASMRAAQELTYIAYNDQPPTALSNSTTNAHSKGIVLFGQQTGIWILHSVPRFPETLFSGRYSFPLSARENAQNMLCITFDIDKLDIIEFFQYFTTQHEFIVVLHFDVIFRLAAHLRIERPNMFAASAPRAVRKRYPELDKLLNKTFSRKSPYFTNGSLLGVNGTPFFALAKGGPVNEDIYSKLIAEAVKSDLFVETWRNGRGNPLPPQCFDKYKTTDVQQVALKVGDKTMRWKSEEDHSKWAVSVNGDWTCIGSLNRMLSQLKRGGETLCLSDRTVHRLFMNAIVTVSQCDTQQTRTRGKTKHIEHLMRTEQANDEDKPKAEGGLRTSNEERPSLADRISQSGLNRMWEKQKRKILVELEGLRASFG